MIVKSSFIAVIAASAGAVLAALATGSVPASILSAAAVLAAMALEGHMRARGGGDGAASSGVEDTPARDSAPGAAQLQAMLDGLYDAALILDRDANVRLANAPARLLLPVTVERHIAQTSRSPELLGVIDRALESRAQQKGEARILGAADHHLGIIATPLGQGPAEGTPALLVVMRDTTDREQLTRMRADFVANASHELRTPLASLKGFLETIRGPAKDDPAARERFLGIMQEQADRMSRLIDDLLSLSRIEMREHVRPEDSVDLAEIVRSLVSTIEPLAAEAGIAIETAVPDAPLVVRGERDDLIQLMQNLAQNAIKYGRRGGKVEIAVRREGHGLALSVTDNGIGIAPEHLPRLTERFYRVSAKDSRERGGTGLGLAIVKHIVNRHQGELRIESKPG